MNDRSRTLNWAVISSIGWFPVAVFALYLKNYHIDANYFSLLYSVSNIDESPSFFDRLFMYKDDFFLGFFLIPSTIIAVLYFFPQKKLVSAICLLFSLVILFLLYANLNSWGTVGRFITYTAAVDAVTFGLQNPTFISAYIDLDSWVKYGTLNFFVLMFFLSSHLIVKNNVLAAVGKYSIALVLAISLVTSGLGYTSSMRDAPINSSFIAASISSILETNSNTGEVKDYANTSEMVNHFQTLTNTVSNNTNGDLFATSKGNDLIVFVLETGAAKFIDLKNDIDSFPTLKKLSANSLIAYKHYSTFPASSESQFSIFVGIYPPRSYYSTCVIGPEIKLGNAFPGFLTRLHDMGYKTSMYFPWPDKVPLDKVLHQNMNVDKLYFAQHHATKKGMTRDMQALTEMKQDLQSMLQSNQRYAAVFLPQIGHAPWSDRPSNRSVQEHGKLVGIKQDRWLGEILDILERHQRLDKTTILVVGDHGIRTAVEDPDFHPGFIDDYSFHVPMLIYSKSSFPQPMLIDSYTSHLDISPSISELYGIERDKSSEQGLSLWDDGIMNRLTYYLGNWYFGSDSFQFENQFHMYSEAIGIAFSNDRLEFGIKNSQSSPDTTANIKNKISSIYGLQEKWVEKFLCNASPDS